MYKITEEARRVLVEFMLNRNEFLRTIVSYPDEQIIQAYEFFLPIHKNKMRQLGMMVHPDVRFIISRALELLNDESFTCPRRLREILKRLIDDSNDLQTTYKNILEYPVPKVRLCKY